jgi:hypothetical protein
MCKQVCVHTQVERKLAAFKKKAKNSSIVAERARRIIDALIQGVPFASAGLLKRKTDKRVKNCFKFDLGLGFRLLCIKERKTIYVMFVGNHDHCDNWLDSYPNKKYSRAEPEMRSYSSSVVEKTGDPLPKEPISMAVPLEDSCLGQITQKDLRRVFRGLTG